MLAPQLDVPDFLAFAARHGAPGVELRNDVPGLAISGASGLSASELRALLRRHGLPLLSINALQRFNRPTNVLLAEAERLIAFTAAAGGTGVVLCPVNDPAWTPDPTERDRLLRESLSALLPILRRHGVVGLVEPLGFVECSLRFKRDAVHAIDAVDGADTLRLVHDTFHHHVSGETGFFPRHTGLVHVSGVSDPAVPREAMRDPHRVLVDAADRLGNLEQLRALRAGGFDGPVSFEPFAAELRGHPEIDTLLGASIAHLATA
ncbi:MAG: TIM barrel protein [Gluconacetobacter diazotrophicus]|nr:TIM barrel protein [Gluconacetobacter diazotrophicus]